MPQPTPEHFAALSALSSAQGDPAAASAALSEHMPLVLDLLHGGYGPGLAQYAESLIQVAPQTSTGDTPQSSNVEAAIAALLAASGPPSNSPPQAPPPVPSLPPAEGPTQARMTTQAPGERLSSIQAAPAPSPTSNDGPATSLTTTRVSITTPSPVPARSHADDDADDVATSEDNADQPLGTKRKRRADDRPASPSASEASGAGRKLRQRRPQAVKDEQPALRRTTRARGNARKGKKKADDVLNERDDKGVDEEIAPKTAPKKVRTPRTSIRPPSPPPAAHLVNDPPCEGCLANNVECLRRETSRPSIACQRCNGLKLRCSLTGEHDSALPHASDGAAPPSSQLNVHAASETQASVAAVSPYATQYGQDPLGLAGLSANIVQLCGHLVRFNANAAIMQAVLGAIEEFNMRVAQLVEHAQVLRSAQAVGGVPAPPSSQSPSAPSRDVSPASQGSRKRRRIERATEGSSGTAQAGGAPSPMAMPAGGSGGAGALAAAAPATSGGAPEAAASSPAPGGIAGGQGAPPHASAQASAEVAAKEASGSGAGPMDVDQPTTA